MTKEHINEIKAIVLLAVGMIIFASLFSFVPDDLAWYTSTPNVPAKNLISTTGAYIAGSLFFCFGFASYFLVFFLLFLSWNIFSTRELKVTVPKCISVVVLLWVLCSFLAMIGVNSDSIGFKYGGLIGLASSHFLVNYFGTLGAVVILTALGALSLVLTGEFLITPLVLNAIEFFQNFGQSLIKQPNKKDVKIEKDKSIKPSLWTSILSRFQKKEEESELAKKLKPKFEKPVGPVVQPQIKKPVVDSKDIDEEEVEGVGPVKPVKPKIKIAEQPKPAQPAKTKEAEPTKKVGEYHLPELDLLDDSPVVSNNKIQSDLMEGAKILEDTLASFGVSAKVADIERGPAITRFELQPASGVKVQKFTSLSDDIALAMKVAAVRIVAPIPGKDRVGIEVPNATAASVFLKDVLSSKEYQTSRSKSKLTIALGKDLGGIPMVADLSSMPHLLIAGTTGSGKSVCVNGIIMSILYNASPDEVKMVMIDPKMVEMAQYNGIPHLLSPTITDPKKASAVLGWVVSEMENRYRKLAKDGKRNIKEYNENGVKMPYIVVIVDELADLMTVSAKTVESSIMRIAQLARAVGIHMILATQRPSVDVITGVIKANFPARISFKVASKIDSRTVLDMNGAEALLGRGDMLFINLGEPKPIRGQGNFVKDGEIRRVIDFIKAQASPEYDDTIANHQTQAAQGGSPQEQDEFYDEAARLVVETNQASVSIIQRRLRLGYTRAARLIDMMEQNGLVGPYCGSKAREILVDREQWLLQNMSSKTSTPSEKNQESEPEPTEN